MVNPRLQASIEKLADLGIKALNGCEVVNCHSDSLTYIPINIADSVIFGGVELQTTKDMTLSLTLKSIESLTRIRDLVDEDIWILEHYKNCSFKGD